MVVQFALDASDLYLSLLSFKVTASIAVHLNVLQNTQLNACHNSAVRITETCSENVVIIPRLNISVVEVIFCKYFSLLELSVCC